MDDLTREWLGMAGQDLDVARHLYETFFPRPLEIVCYHCQQAAEKAVKAVLVCEGASVPRSHDVSYLLGRLPQGRAVDDGLLDAADALTPYGVAVRYPNELGLEDRHAEQALEHASRLLSWAAGQIGPDPSG